MLIENAIKAAFFRVDSVLVSDLLHELVDVVESKIHKIYQKDGNV